MGAHLSTCIGLSLTIVSIFVQFPGPVQAVAVQLFDDGAVENHALADAISAAKHKMQAHTGMELGRRGGSSMMTSGSFTMMSSNRAGNSEDDEEEDAELAESGGGAVEALKSALRAFETKETHHKKASQQLLTRIKAVKAKALGESIASRGPVPSNGAKCAGDKQDQSQLKGTMECDSVPGPEPKNCPDNLSGGGYWQCGAASQGGRCTSFSGNNAIKRQAIIVLPDHYKTKGQACQDVVTKGAVAHPHQAERNVGLLALKRVKCDKKDPPTCEVYKTTVCISVPKDECPSGKTVDKGICNMFASILEKDATDAELAGFANRVSEKAWVNAGTPTAKLKEDWSCKGMDASIADRWVRAF